MPYQVTILFKNNQELPYSYDTESFVVSEVLDYIRNNTLFPVQSIKVSTIDNNAYQCVNCKWIGLNREKKRIALDSFVQMICCPSCNKGIFNKINQN